MLKETMLAMRVTEMEYGPDICRLLQSAEIDLKMAGVVIEGQCDFDITETEDVVTGKTTITIDDHSTITDKKVLTAMITYCRFNFGSPADYDKLAASYDLQRRQLANATGYTNFGEDDGDEQGTHSDADP